MSVCATVAIYYRTLPLAGYILLPSAVWITAATALVTHIWYLNGKEPLYPFKRQDTPAPLPVEEKVEEERDAAAAD
jgi:tryptophan-rich sensory protein